MATDDRTPAQPEPDPNDTPFELPAVEGLPFDDDSEEARAIQRIIERSDRERAAATRSERER